MTPDQAMDAWADEIVAEVLEEVVQNGMIDTYADASLSYAANRGIRKRLLDRIASRPAPEVMRAARAMLSQEVG